MHRAIRLTLAAASALAVSLTAAAQAFPDHPVKFYCPAAPGGSADAVTRAIADSMSRDFGVPVVVENKPGAGGVVATEAVLKAPADGYTITLVNSSHSTNPVLLKSLPYDTLKDTIALDYVGYIPLVLVTPPSSPYTSVQQVIAAAKAAPGTIAFASGGVGSGGHLAGELLKYIAQVDMIHVPYQGNAPSLTSVLGGHNPLMFDTLANSLPHIQAGKLRVLAITSLKRSPLLPNVPTMVESGVPDFEISAWIAIVGKSGTPPDVVAKLNGAINKAINDPALRARPTMQGIEFVGGSVDDAQGFVRRELEKWTKVVKAAGISGS